MDPNLDDSRVLPNEHIDPNTSELEVQTLGGMHLLLKTKNFMRLQYTLKISYIQEFF